MTFDPACYALAAHFLPDDATEARKCELAEWVQFHVKLFLDMSAPTNQTPPARLLPMPLTGERSDVMKAELGRLIPWPSLKLTR